MMTKAEIWWVLIQSICDVSRQCVVLVGTNSANTKKSLTPKVFNNYPFFAHIYVI